MPNPTQWDTPMFISEDTKPAIESLNRHKQVYWVNVFKHAFGDAQYIGFKFPSKNGAIWEASHSGNCIGRIKVTLK